jgi:DNA-binding beta-propeller fold protein YncE
VVATVTVGSEPTGVTVTPNGDYVFVTNAGSDTVSVISTVTTASPTPKVPEFSNIAFVSVSVAIAAVTLCAIALTARTRKRLQK